MILKAYWQTEPWQEKHAFAQCGKVSHPPPKPESPYDRVMFDALKNLGGIADLMRKAGELQERMRRLQDELAKKTVSADAGAGAVTAVVNGKLELVSLRIDRERIDPNDTELVEDLVVAAVGAAQVKARDLIQQEMSRMSQEMGLPAGMMPPGMLGSS
mgnify:FL=1